SGSARIRRRREGRIIERLLEGGVRPGQEGYATSARGVEPGREHRAPRQHMPPPARTDKMRLSILSRRLHRWGAVLAALPILLVIGSGLVLQVKKQVPWVQPVEQRTSESVPVVDWASILATAQSV